jgi:ubiquinone biosynthesis protein
MMREIANLFLGFAEHDYDLVMAALLGAGLIDEDSVDLRRFKRDLKDISEPFYGRALQTISVKDVYDQVMRLVLKYNIRLPQNLLLLLKTFIQTEALGKILGSDASILEVTRPYAQRLLQQGYDARKLFRNIGYDARTMGNTMRLLPKFIQDVVRQFGSGKPRMEVAHTGFEGFDQKIEKGINRFTVGLVVSASLIAASLILNSSQTVMEFQVDFFGPQTLSITALLGLTGYTMATLLGLWLIISIFRSGKL